MWARLGGGLILTAWFVTSSGCGVTEKKWDMKSAKVSCKMAKRCSTAQFFYNYDNLEECVDDALEQNEDRYEDYIDECFFDPKQARACLKAMRSTCKSIGADYEELYDACYKVWECQEVEFDSATGMPWIQGLEN